MKTLTLPASQNKYASFALTALITGAITIGFSAIFVRLSEVGPITTAFWRMALSVPTFWLWMTLERRQSPDPKPALSRTDYRWLIAAGLFFGCDLIAWHLSITFTTVANSVLLANFAPVFVTIGGWILFRQRVTFTFVVGMIVALVGATMLVGASFNLSMRHLIGDMLALVTAVFYGGYILSVKRLRSKFSTPTIMSKVAVISAVILLPVALLAEDALFPLTLSGWAMLLGLGWISHTGGQGLITFALAHLPASFSSVTLLLQPVLSAIFAWMLLDEILSPRQILGGLIVLTGIFIARRASR